ncbi:4-diphosphocytidyl-2-C-methyl-D-erythritol kinase [Abditibacterium utsteinense]|uniref:4-diphosphocytidyl-2-C-methyl-D-erythritol kinase n=1 Tax=Abditibacterium utsteinense TaxID=1960156 RepID=A0A2S8SXE5_9BACT|nr:4-(cytidine 5'-diphospho)-2-C-methyl-D-erythritol kinase [Abditibacterium utsteinense]PQV65473.1 4-diphosphocytidyl-2-C-methyl-D-erythritol kinase [Abditibacterium utsteinense]
MKFHLRSAAKVNLTLDILSRRADGYHELASVVHTVGIWDDIDIELTKNQAIEFTCNRGDLAGDDNLCVRAVRKWNEATGDKFGATIHLEKRIPTGAGLGGGSGNAAAILLALNRAATVEVTEETLRNIGAKLGADVPLFLRGGAVLMEGIGEKLTPLAPKTGWLIVIKPQESFSTPEIYRLVDEQNRFSGRAEATMQMLANWHRDSLSKLAQEMGNDLQLPAQSVSTLPRICTKILREAGALGAQMSGSGSACFGIFETQLEAQQAREKLESELAKLVPLQNSRLFVAPLCARGIEIMSTA